jgi:hypothetical protein
MAWNPTGWQPSGWDQTGWHASTGEGGELVEVPDVVGDDEATATATLEGAGFTVTVSFANSSVVAAGLVVAQSPTAGSSAASGSAVQIVVSLGPSTRGLFSARATNWNSGSISRDRNRRTAMALMRFSALVGAPVDLGNVAAAGTSDELVLPANARLAVSHTAALDLAVVTINVGAGSFSHPALAADAIHKGNFGEAGRVVTIERGAAPAGTFTLYVVDMQGVPRAIATVTFT